MAKKTLEQINVGVYGEGLKMGRKKTVEVSPKRLLKFAQEVREALADAAAMESSEYVIDTIYQAMSDLEIPMLEGTMDPDSGDITHKGPTLAIKEDK